MKVDMDRLKNVIEIAYRKNLFDQPLHRTGMKMTPYTPFTTRNSIIKFHEEYPYILTKSLDSLIMEVVGFSLPCEFESTKYRIKLADALAGNFDKMIIMDRLDISQRNWEYVRACTDEYKLIESAHLVCLFNMERVFTQ